MKKLILSILFVLFSSPSWATTIYPWNSYIGTTCSTVTTGTDHMICLDSVTGALWKCVTSTGFSTYSNSFSLSI